MKGVDEYPNGALSTQCSAPVINRRRQRSCGELNNVKYVLQHRGKRERVLNRAGSDPPAFHILEQHAIVRHRPAKPLTPFMNQQKEDISTRPI